MKKLGGLCAMRYALVKTPGSDEWTRLDIDDAFKHQHGKCELCGGEVGARKGDIRANHWYHLDGRGECDPWHEPKGEWHRRVQGCFPVSRQEFVMRRSVDGKTVKHIADIYTKSGYVIEVQMSPLSIAKIAEREEFYGRIVWFVSGHNPMTENFRTESFLSDAEFVQGDGFEYFVIPEANHAINRHWANRPGLVFFDIDPESGADLENKNILCLVPGTSRHGYCVCRILKEQELIDAFLGDNAQEFIDRMLKTADDFFIRFNKETRKAEEELDRRVDRLRNREDVEEFRQELAQEMADADEHREFRIIGMGQRSRLINAKLWKPKVKLNARHREKLSAARLRRRWKWPTPGYSQWSASSRPADYPSSHPQQWPDGPVSNTPAAWRPGEKEWWVEHLAAKRRRWQY